jgi:hypothetical protein
MKKIIYLLASLLIFLIIGLLILSLIPNSNPVKDFVNMTMNKAKYGNSIKNFSSYDAEQSGTKIVKVAQICDYSVKFKETTLNNVEQPKNSAQLETITLYKPDNKDSNSPDVQFICIKLDDVIDKFRENVISIWDKNPKVQEQFGVTSEAARKLSKKEFYKLYTAKVTSNCSAQTDYNDVKFLNNNVITDLMKDYNKCKYDNPQTNKNITEYYLFPNDDTKPVLFIRTTNADSFADSFLVIKK